MLFTVLSYAQLGVNGNIIEINKEMVGLGNIDNTSDNNKPGLFTLMPSKTNCTMIFINQLREKIGVMFGNPRVYRV